MASQIHLNKEELKLSIIGKFQDTVVEMAQCQGALVVPGVITVDIKTTGRLAMWDIIRYAFPSIMQPEFYEIRTNLVAQLSEAYKAIKDSFTDFANRKQPEMFNQLREYQKEGVMYGVLRRHNLLAFEQGLGKSITAICINEMLQEDKCFIVAPAACKWNWVEELVNWGIKPENITVLDSKQPIYSMVEKYIIINYDIIESFLEYIYKQKPTHFILDEAHKVKNADSNRSKVMVKLVEDINPKLTFLSGTPTPNKTGDIWIYLQLAKHHFGLRGIKYFKQEFFTRVNGKEIPRPRLGYLNSCLSNLMVRRTKAKDLDLPPKIYHKVHFRVDHYAEKYNQALEEALEKIRANIAKTGKGNLELAMQRLCIVASMAKIDNILQLANDIVDKKYTVTLSEKIIEGEGFKQSSKITKEVNGKVIIFSAFTEPLNYLQDKLGSKCLRIDGSVDTKMRLSIVNQFKRSYTKNYLICNTDAAGIGLNIVNKITDTDRPPIADVIHVNLPLTFAQFEQANDRVHRIGQYVPVNVWNTIAEKTIDEAILRLIERKYGDVSKLIDGAEQSFDFNQLELTDLISIEEENETLAQSIEDANDAKKEFTEEVKTLIGI